MFLCCTCGRDFRTKSILRRHKIQKGHDFLGPLAFLCPDCIRSFETQEACRAHIEDVHDWNDWQLEEWLEEHEDHECLTCRKDFSNYTILGLHQEQKGHYYPGPLPWECELCPRSFDSSTGLDNHFRDCHSWEELKNLGHTVKIQSEGYSLYLNEDDHECLTCGKEFPNDLFLGLHQQAKNHYHHGPLPLKCKMCPRSFETSKGREAHFRDCHGSCKDDSHHSLNLTNESQQSKECIVFLNDDADDFECLTCGKGFSGDLYLGLHQQQKDHYHAGPLPWKCHVCPRSFDTSRGYDAHYRDCHSPEKGDNLIVKIETQVKYSFHLDADDDHECLTCGKDFPNDLFLGLHQEQKNHFHPGPLPWLCKLCPRSFESSAGHLSHFRDCH